MRDELVSVINATITTRSRERGGEAIDRGSNRGGEVIGGNRERFNAVNQEEKRMTRNMGEGGREDRSEGRALTPERFERN
jgi:hypothetical protein